MGAGGPLAEPKALERLTGRRPIISRWQAIEIILVIVIAIFPLFVGGFQVQLATKILLFVVLALSLDIVWGYGGILDLGHAFYFGVSAYVVAMLAKNAGLTAALIALPLATAIGALLALLVGMFLLLGRRKLSPIFVAMATLALSYIAERTAAFWYFIGAANGIPSIPLMTIGLPGMEGLAAQPGVGFYYAAAVLTVAVYLALRWLTGSQFGLVLAAARHNELRVDFLGYKTAYFKLLVNVLGGALAGLVGAIYTFHEGFVGPGQLGINLSTQMVLWILAGGSGSLLGAVIGTIAMNYASFQLSGVLLTLWQAALGAILIAIMLFLPRGLISLVVPKSSATWTNARSAREDTGERPAA